MFLSFIIILNLNRRTMLQDLCDVALSIRFSQSQDSETSQRQSPEKEKDYPFKVKCFKCKAGKSSHCSECYGSHQIMSTHPMAALLNDVLMRKLNIKTGMEGRDVHEKVEPIKQEEEDTQQRRLICTYCEKECEISMYYCDECPYFNVCINCQSRICDHHHKLSPNLAFSNCLPVIMAEHKKSCNNCNSKIENCYSECKTCKDEGIFYILCDTCTDNNSYIHSFSHNLETVIDYDSFKDNNIDTISQEFEDDEHQEELFQDEPDFKNLSVAILQKKNSSIANFMENSDHHSFHNPSIDVLKRPAEASRVKFDVDGLFSSYDTINDKMSFKQVPKSSLSHKSEAKYCSSISNFSNKISYKQNVYPQAVEESKDYVFLDYRCDICETDPIVNVRYHCEECQDFDVCEMCYQSSMESHFHYNFSRIDGRLIRQKAVERLLQMKDINIKVSYVGVASNIKTSSALPVRKVKRNQTHCENTEPIN